MGWLMDNWQPVWGIGAVISAPLVALIIFVCIWWFAATRYQLGGLVLGWIPAGIAACVGGLVLGGLWPITLILALIYGAPIVAAIGDIAADRA